MNEDLYQPLPSTDAYLKRLGICKTGEPTAEFLDELIYAHQLHIPFENLDISEEDLIPSLAIKDLFEKIVIQHRGGYCFELNALFACLLKALGYSVTPHIARTQLRPLPYPVCSHRVNIVTIDSKRYLVDVGFGGPMASFAPLIEDGAMRTKGNQTFTMHKCERFTHCHPERSEGPQHTPTPTGFWWEVGYHGSKEEERRVLRILDIPATEEDFIALSFFQAKSDDSVFKNNRTVNIKTKDGARSLKNTTYTEFHANKKHTTEIDEAEILQLLFDKFGIMLE